MPVQSNSSSRGSKLLSILGININKTTNQKQKAAGITPESPLRIGAAGPVPAWFDNVVNSYGPKQKAVSLQQDLQGLSNAVKCTQSRSTYIQSPATTDGNNNDAVTLRSSSPSKHANGQRKREYNPSLNPARKKLFFHDRGSVLPKSGKSIHPNDGTKDFGDNDVARTEEVLPSSVSVPSVSTHTVIVTNPSPPSSPVLNHERDVGDKLNDHSSRINVFSPSTNSTTVSSSPSPTSPNLTSTQPTLTSPTINPPDQVNDQIDKSVFGDDLSLTGLSTNSTTVSTFPSPTSPNSTSPQPTLKSPATNPLDQVDDQIDNSVFGNDDRSLTDPEQEVFVLQISGNGIDSDQSILQLENLFEGDENLITLEVFDDVNGNENNPQVAAAVPNTANNNEANEEEILQLQTASAEKKKLTRKRSRNPSNYKEAKAKEALYKGEAHLNKEGKFRPAPVMRLPCACKQKCSLKVSEQDRIENFELYTRTMGSKDRQWAFIRAHSTSGPVKTRTTENNATPKKKASRKYFLQVSAEEKGEKKNINVCKVMFMNTLCIWDGVIDSAYNHVNEKTKTPTPDKRGKHKNRPHKTTEGQKASIRAHIGSYPRVPSHYVRAKSLKEYFEHGLNVDKMYRGYKIWCEENSIPAKDRASKRQYNTVFNYEYNIGFFKPKKDRCQLCMLMKTATRREREKYKYQFVEHMKNKKGAYKELHDARKLLTVRRDVAMLSFDLQRVLPCPKSETSVFFYKNKLSVYNLTTYSNREHQGTCYLWHNGIGKRGSNEVGTCVKDALTEAAKSGSTEVISFSDSCAGQNRNRFIYAMINKMSVVLNIKIRHNFLEPGHTYNDADGVHARIDGASRGIDIYDFDEWVELIKNAKVETPMYKVKVLKRNDFLDLKDLVQKQNWEKDTTGRKITWNKVKVVEAGYHQKGVLALQYTFGGDKVFLNPSQRKGHPVNLETYKYPLAHPEKILLKQKTVKHLQELMKSLAIPSKYHSFFQNVINNVEPTEEDDAEDDPDDPQVAADSVDPDCLVDDYGGLGFEFEKENDADGEQGGEGDEDREQGGEGDEDGEPGEAENTGDET